MKVEIRLYKTYDVDLIALLDAWYPVFSMIRDVVIAYANGEPLNYYIDEEINFDMNDKQVVRGRISFPKSEKNALYLLQNIKHRYRNAFCKMLLRNALVQQNVMPYFAESSLNTLQQYNMRGKNLKNYPNLIYLSTLREDVKQINVAGMLINVENKNVPYARQSNVPFAISKPAHAETDVSGLNLPPLSGVSAPQFEPHAPMPIQQEPMNVAPVAPVTQVAPVSVPVAQQVTAPQGYIQSPQTPQVPQASYAPVPSAVDAAEQKIPERKEPVPQDDTVAYNPDDESDGYSNTTDDPGLITHMKDETILKLFDAL